MEGRVGQRTAATLASAGMDNKYLFFPQLDRQTSKIPTDTDTTYKVLEVCKWSVRVSTWYCTDARVAKGFQ